MPFAELSDVLGPRQGQGEMQSRLLKKGVAPSLRKQAVLQYAADLWAMLSSQRLCHRP